MGVAVPLPPAAAEEMEGFQVVGVVAIAEVVVDLVEVEDLLDPAGVDLLAGVDLPAGVDLLAGVALVDPAGADLVDQAGADLVDLVEVALVDPEGAAAGPAEVAGAVTLMDPAEGAGAVTPMDPMAGPMQHQMQATPMPLALLAGNYIPNSSRLIYQILEEIFGFTSVSEGYLWPWWGRTQIWPQSQKCPTWWPT